MKSIKSSFLVLFVFSLLLYGNTLNHDYVLDDSIAITENFVVKKGIEGIPLIWKTHYHYGFGYQAPTIFRPLSLTLFALQWEIAPNEAMLGHATNLLLYGILSVFLFQLLMLLFGKTNKILAFMSTVLFIAHPIHTEVVANIKSADDLLVFNLCIGAYLLLIRYLSNQKIGYFVLSILLVGLSYFAKESTLTLVMCIPFMLVLFFDVPWLRAIKLSSFYAIPTALFIFARTKVLGGLMDTNTSSLDNILIAAPDGLIFIATALKIMGLYLYKLIFPHPLMIDYSWSQIELNGAENPFTWISLLVYAGLIYTVIKFWKRKKILVFGILFFLINFSLYTNLFFTIGTSFGERLLFIPSLGFSICCAYLLTRVLSGKSIPNSLHKQPKLIAALVVIVALYAFKTVDRNQDWKNNFTLYTTDVKNCDRSARCHYHNGLAIMKSQALTATNQNQKKRYLKNAISAFQQAIALHSNYSEAHAEIGLAYFRLNEFEKAEKSYLKSIELNPSNATALSNLGSLYFNTQRYKLAKSTYEKALQMNPNHIDGLANYASTLGTLGDYEGAIRYFKKAIALRPGYSNYHKMLGITYRNVGKPNEADYHLKEAQRLQSK